jgi:hypothetical protein
MGFLVFTLAYAVILLGFIAFVQWAAEHDPQDYFRFGDSHVGKLIKQTSFKKSTPLA